MRHWYRAIRATSAQLGVAQLGVAPLGVPRQVPSRRFLATRFAPEGTRKPPPHHPGGQQTKPVEKTQLLEGPPVLIYESRKGGLVLAVSSFALVQGVFWAWMAEWAWHGLDRGDTRTPQAAASKQHQTQRAVASQEQDVYLQDRALSTDLDMDTGNNTATAVTAEENNAAVEAATAAAAASGKKDIGEGAQGWVRTLVWIGSYMPYMKPHEQSILYSVISVLGFGIVFLVPGQVVNRMELRSKGTILRMGTYSPFGRQRVKDVPLANCKRGESSAIGFDGYVTYAHKGWWLPFACDRTGFHKGGQRVFDMFIKP